MHALIQDREDANVTAIHIVTLDDGHLGLSMIAAVYVLPLGILFAAIRMGSGSPLGGVFNHNAIIFIGDLSGFF